MCYFKPESRVTLILFDHYYFNKFLQITGLGLKILRYYELNNRITYVILIKATATSKMNIIYLTKINPKSLKNKRKQMLNTNRI